MTRVHAIEAADLAMVCARARARQSLADLAIEAFTEAARLYRVAGLSLMADRAERCTVAVMATVERSAVAS